MDDDIYFALEHLDSLKSDDDLLNIRVQIEIAQFCWRNYKETHCKFKL